MFSILRDRFGIPGVLSVVALVFAMAGGAFAASSSDSGGSKATASAKAKKGPRGPRGPAGLQGPAGPAGSAGKDGANGTNGTNGTAGANGLVGATGATGPAGAPGPACPVGACLLPEEATETGTWGTGSSTPAGNKTFPISFSLPLSAEPQAILVKANEQSKPGCPGRGGGEFGPSKPGNVPTIPMAAPGKLCVYVMASEGATMTANPFKKFEYEPGFAEWELVNGSSRTGTLLEANCGTTCFVGGTWAVTGPEE